jgi:hypothetical protein
VALTTRISEGVWLEGYKFFGVDLPKGVTHCRLIRDHLWDVVNVQWITKDGVQHSMPFEQTDEGVIAALAAMKLTC